MKRRTPNDVGARVYNLLAEAEIVPATKRTQGKISDEQLARWAAVWEQDGERLDKIGAAVTALEHGRPLSERDNFLSDDSREAMRKKGRRFADKGKRHWARIDEDIAQFYRGEINTEPEAVRRRFVRDFKPFLKRWLAKESLMERDRKG